MTREEPSHLANIPWQDARMILFLFILTRFMCLCWFTPAYSEFTEYQYDLAALSDKGCYPFFHYWLEYPPIFPWISVGIYQLTHFQIFQGIPHISQYAIGLGIVMIFFESGILCLIFAIAFSLHGKAVAEKVSWIYSCLFLSFFTIPSFFDSIPSFLILLAIYWIVCKNKCYLASLVIAFGIAVKLIPLVLIPLLYKKREKILPHLMAITCSFVLFLPFLFVRPCWFKVFVDVTIKRPGWETIWAIAEGHYSFSYLGPVPKISAQDEAKAREILLKMRVKSRFSTDISYIPESGETFKRFYLICGLCAFLIFYKAWRNMPKEQDSRRLFAFAGFCCMLFFLYSKGWSPQFLIYVLPLILIGFPDKIWISVVLLIIGFFEMPVWLFLFPENEAMLTLLVLARTGIFVYCAWLFWRLCKQGTVAVVLNEIG